MSTLLERIKAGQKVCSDCGRTQSLHWLDAERGRLDHNFREATINRKRFNVAKDTTNV